LTTPDGSVTEEWRSATEHSLVFSAPEAEQRFARLDAEARRLDALVPPYSGNEWLTLQFSRSSKLFPPPLPWLIAGLAAWLWRRPARPGLAACLGAAGLGVVVFQALAIYSIVEFAIPVAPAFVVVGSAGLLGERRTR
jgi:anti-sigma factor RsiW